MTVGWGVDLRYADRSDSWSISLVRNDLQVSVFDEILDGHPMTIVVLLVVDPQKELKVTSFDLIKKRMATCRVSSAFPWPTEVNTFEELWERIQASASVNE